MSSDSLNTSKLFDINRTVLGQVDMDTTDVVETADIDLPFMDTGQDCSREIKFDSASFLRNLKGKPSDWYIIIIFFLFPFCHGHVSVINSLICWLLFMYMYMQFEVLVFSSIMNGVLSLLSKALTKINLQWFYFNFFLPCRNRAIIQMICNQKNLDIRKCCYYSKRTIWLSLTYSNLPKWCRWYDK